MSRSTILNSSPAVRRSFRTMVQRHELIQSATLAARSAPYSGALHSTVITGLHDWLAMNRAATDRGSPARAHVCHNGLSLRTTSWSEHA